MLTASTSATAPCRSGNFFRERYSGLWMLHLTTSICKGWKSRGYTVPLDGKMRSAFDLLRYQTISSAEFVKDIPLLANTDPRLLARIDTEGRYQPFLARQQADLRDFMVDESLLLDPMMDYLTVKGLSSEIRERLFKVRPTTIVIVRSGEESGGHDAVIDGAFAQTCEEDVSSGPGEGKKDRRLHSTNKTSKNLKVVK
ncbi:hypothetical protein F5146DRAFT_1004287 [Armillaria mellea]|nr:hypothetical protein F5146DRAFT_1004287 [Armillaria mellea]